MSCLFPGAGFKTGNLTDNGKDDLIIMPHDFGDLLSLDHAESIKHVCPGAPIKVIAGVSYLCDPVPIPCCNCVGCRLDKARHWKNRLCLEALNYPPEDVHFITLTYDDEHLPVNDDGQPYLEKTDFQKFMKLMRRYNGSFRYFACGEYGSIGKRPHFHSILFGHLDALKPQGVNKFYHQGIDLSWHRGIIEVKTAEPGCMAYVAGYVEKKQADPDYYTYPVKPFLLMSDRPGIGFSYISKIDLLRDPHIYANFGGSHSSTIPPALLRKMENAPGYDVFKKQLKDKGISKSLQFSNIYNNSMASCVADVREYLLNKNLQKNRKDKL